MRIKFLLALIMLSVFAAHSARAGWVTKESGTSQTLNAVFAVDDAIVYAAGNGGTILRSLNSGSTWETKTSGTAENLNDILFPSAAEGYVLGANGTALKSTDQGETYAPLPLPPALSSANFKKGSFSGANRALAASTGPATDSYLLSSTDGGSSFTPSSLSNFDAAGVFLDSAGSTWLWGRYFAGTYASQYVILKDNNVVWSDATRAIKDLLMVDASVGYAVGDSGLVLKTSAGGDSGEWSEVSAGVSENLNALYFITSAFGWVVGENGAIAFTWDGGATWTSYTLDDPSVDIKDIHVKLVALASSASLKAAAISISQAQAVVHAYLAGSGGKVYKLGSPAITSVSPTSEAQGWLGTVEVTGSGFISGANATFSRSGTTEADPEILVLSTSFESATKVIATIMISAEATLGLRNITLTNPDATTSIEADVFNVASNEARVTFSNIWIDGNKYLPPVVVGSPETTINQNPFVSFEAGSPNGMSVSSANVRVLTQYKDALGSDQNILTVLPQSALTQLSTTAVHAGYIVPDDLPAGMIVNFSLYAEDDQGYVGWEYLVTWVAQPETPPADSTPPAGSGGLPGIFVPSKNTFDPETEVSLPAVVQLQPGFSVRDLTIIVTDFTGRRIYQTKLIKGTSSFNARSLATPRGYVTKINLDIKASELAPYLPTGMYMVLVIDNETGKLVAKSPLSIAHRSLMP